MSSLGVECWTCWPEPAWSRWRRGRSSRSRARCSRSGAPTSSRSSIRPAVTRSGASCPRVSFRAATASTSCSRSPTAGSVPSGSTSRPTRGASCCTGSSRPPTSSSPTTSRTCGNACASTSTTFAAATRTSSTCAARAKGRVVRMPSAVGSTVRRTGRGRVWPWRSRTPRPSGRSTSVPRSATSSAA